MKKELTTNQIVYRYMMLLLLGMLCLNLIACEAKDAGSAQSLQPPVESPVAPVAPTVYTYTVHMWSPGSNVWTYFAYNAETPTHNNSNPMRLWSGGETITIQGTELDLVVVNYVDPENLGVPANPLTVEIRKNGAIIQSVILTGNLEDVEFQGL